MTEWKSIKEKGFYYISNLMNKDFTKKLKEHFPNHIYKETIEIKIALENEVVKISYPYLEQLSKRELYIETEKPETLEKIKTILKEIEELKENKCKEIE